MARLVVTGTMLDALPSFKWDEGLRQLVLFSLLFATMLFAAVSMTDVALTTSYLPDINSLA